MRAAVLALVLAAPAAHAALRVVEPLAWARPGADPYTGGVAAALNAMHLPHDVRARLADRIERGDADGTAWFRADGIVADDGTPFAQHFDMGSGAGWTVGSRVGFGAERTERAALYREGIYAVAVPDACGNVARLYPPGWPADAAPPVGPLPAPALPPGGWWPGAPIPPVLHGGPGGAYPVGVPAGGWPLLPPGGVPVGFVPEAPPGWSGAPLPVPAVPVDAPAPALLLAAGVLAAALRRLT